MREPCEATSVGPAGGQERREIYALLMQAPAPILILEGPEQRIAFRNAAAAELLGNREIAGVPVEEAVPELRGHGALAPLLRVFLTGEQATVHEVPFLSHRPEGRLERYLSGFGQPVRDAGGRVIGVMTLWLDVTEQVLARRKLEEQHRATEAARERLAETLRLNELFVAVLGHDLRTPLSAISLAAAMLLKRSALQPEDARAVARMASSANRIARMIGQVLDLSRSRLGGGVAVQPERLDLHELARRVVDEVKLAHPEASFRLSMEGDGWGEWDPDRLAQVISNLSGNAVEHGASGPVTMVVKGSGEAVSLSVHNDGPPIPAESLETIFDAFRRGTRGPTASGGLGLGLYITQEIVRAHGGSIQVRSSEEHGTTFEVLLPRRASGRALEGGGTAERPHPERAAERAEDPAPER